MKKVIRTNIIHALKVISLSIMMAGILAACGSKDSIVGTWVSDGGDIVIFEEDGTCTAPFTYNASWWESATNYAITDDVLYLSSKEGHANEDYEKADSEEEALEKSNTYYVDGDTLIIDGDTYIRSE